MESMKERWGGYILNLQNEICAALEAVDGRAKFEEDAWERPGGGGGKTRIIANGAAIEKGGVNTSTVFGRVTEPMRQQLGIDGHKWFAAGLSLVIHPTNPMAPTVHANWRYFELYDAGGAPVDSWFGGGMDLTPYYVFEEDARFFHRQIKDAMDPFGTEYYPRYKQECDEYFNNHHRGTETRGIGGVFYDHLRPNAQLDSQALFQFQQANGQAFLSAYIPILNRRKDIPYTPAQKYWQEIRRGRYVEFNLLHDRGTLFGLRTNGRVESILMSLPPTVRFDYGYVPKEGSPEAAAMAIFQTPRAWL